jgi:hypothetical protein
MARAMLLLAAVLLAVPGTFISAKGLRAIRDRSLVVQGRPVEGAPARVAGGVLVAYGVAMVLIGAALLLAVILKR